MRTRISNPITAISKILENLPKETNPVNIAEDGTPINSAIAVDKLPKNKPNGLTIKSSININKSS